MPRLYERDLDRRETRALAGRLTQFAGVRLMTLGDGVEAGVRMLEFRTGTGLRFTVLVDRAFDVAECEHAGRAIGWHSPAGFRNPGLHDDEGEGGLGWLRSFSGLNVTAGLDHIFGAETEGAEHFAYAGRKSVTHSIHGRVSTIPARLVGYGERWEGDRCVLWAEGEVRQATVFGEHLVLTRRIEAEVGGDAFTLRDVVTNEGFYPTPHMLLYHVNVGHPVVEAGSRYLAPVRRVVYASHADRLDFQGVGYRTMGGPQERFFEQVWQFEMACDEEHRVPVAMVNDRIGFGFLIETDRRQFPCYVQWQNLQAGMYAVGLEPATNHVRGKAFARERGELIVLGAGESRSYSARFEALDGAAAIAAAEARIRAIGPQPDVDYPRPDGDFPRLPVRRPD